MKMGFPAALTLLFIGLKLAHYIDWSWWYVTAPSWGIVPVCLALWLFCQFMVLAIEVGQRLCETKEETKKRHSREKLADSLENLQKAMKR